MVEKLEAGKFYFVPVNGPMKAIYYPSIEKGKRTVVLKQPAGGVYYAHAWRVTEIGTEDLLMWANSYEQNGDNEGADVLRRWANGIPEKKMYAVYPKSQKYRGSNAMGMAIEADSIEEAYEIFKEKAYAPMTGEKGSSFKPEDLEIEVVESSLPET